MGKPRQGYPDYGASPGLPRSPRAPPAGGSPQPNPKEQQAESNPHSVTPSQMDRMRQAARIATAETFEFFSFVLKLQIVSSIFSLVFYHLLYRGIAEWYYQNCLAHNSFWQFFSIRAYTDITCKYSNYAQNMVHASIVRELMSLFTYLVQLFHERISGFITRKGAGRFNYQYRPSSR